MVYNADLNDSNSSSDKEISYKVENKNLTDRRITLPDLNSEFAEFMGALAGDGHITNCSNHYRIEFTLNGTEDRYYAKFLARKFRELFHMEPRLYRRSGEANRVDVQIHSKKIHCFLNQFFPKGKKDSLAVPKWIKKDESFQSSYLRGLIDTDGSLFFAKRGMYEKNSYPVIELKMEDPEFLDEIELLLENLSIDYYRAANNKIQLNGENKLEKWMSKIGFSNPGRSSRYAVWKVQNYCPPDTSLYDRLQILKDL